MSLGEEALRGTRLAIFDLDGTLVDSERDLIDSINQTRNHFDLPSLSDAQVVSFVGNGAPVLVRRAMFDHRSTCYPDAFDATVNRALRYFLDYHREHMLDHTLVYPGVREGLDLLHGEGIKMAVLTNKPVRFSVTMLENLGLDLHFFRIYGGNSFPEKKPHPCGIDALRHESGIAAEQTLMVGDTSVDIQTARNAGVAACGVSWGFKPETFAETPPDVVIGDLRVLAELIHG